MTKIRVSPEMIPHLWANATQHEARNRGQCGSNFWFIGPILNSYSTSIGNRIDSDTVLLSVRTYSNTTAKQLGSARSATRHFANRFTVYNVQPVSDSDHRANIDDYCHRATRLLEQAAKARTRRDSLEHQAQSIIDECSAYAKRFKIRWQWKGATAWQKASDAARRKAEKERVARQRAAMVRDAESFADWQSGRTRYCPSSYRTMPDGTVYCRIGSDDNGATLETSMGVSVPLDHAIRVYHAVKRCKMNGTNWKRDTSHHIGVGVFQVDRINSDGSFVAGCHSFNWQEINRIAIVAGIEP